MGGAGVGGCWSDGWVGSGDLVGGSEYRVLGRYGVPVALLQVDLAGVDGVGAGYSV